jgi:hypothetical protein
MDSRNRRNPFPLHPGRHRLDRENRHRLPGHSCSPPAIHRTSGTPTTPHPPIPRIRLHRPAALLYECPQWRHSGSQRRTHGDPARPAWLRPQNDRGPRTPSDNKQVDPNQMGSSFLRKHQRQNCRMTTPENLFYKRATCDQHPPQFSSVTSIKPFGDRRFHHFFTITLRDGSILTAHRSLLFEKDVAGNSFSPSSAFALDLQPVSD